MREGNSGRRAVSGGVATLDLVLKGIDRENNHGRAQHDQDHPRFIAGSNLSCRKRNAVKLSNCSYDCIPPKGS